MSAVIKSEQNEPRENPSHTESREAKTLFKQGIRYLKSPTPDQFRAAECFHKAALLGHNRAKFKLAKLIAEDLVSARTFGSAIVWLESAAMSGLTDAQMSLANAYKNGVGVTQDFYKAFTLYHQAAMQDVPAAQFNLGLAYKDGSGVEADMRLSAHWFCQAAKSGHVLARYELIAMLTLNRVKYDQIKRHDRWFTRTLLSQCPEMECELALRYVRGDGVPRDVFEAARWLCSAAEKGSARAYFNLGMLRMTGLGLAKDVERARCLIVRAAEAGYKPARRWLARQDFSN